MYCPKSNTFHNTYLSQGYVCTSSILVNLLTEKTMEETWSGASEVLDRLPGPTDRQQRSCLQNRPQQDDSRSMHVRNRISIWFSDGNLAKPLNETTVSSDVEKDKTFTINQTSSNIFHVHHLEE